MTTAGSGFDPIARAYDDHSAELFRYARALVGSDDDAEDAVCEVFLQLVRDRTRLGRVQHVRNYLFRATRNAVYRMFRDAGRRDHLVRNAEWDLTCRQPKVDESGIETIMEGFAQMPIEQREVVALKTLYGLTFREIGEIIGKSENTVSSRYRYAIERLRAAARGCEHETRTN
jgi:RNA polymerase sigma-70 factor (ECF subfamily)